MAFKNVKQWLRARKQIEKTKAAVSDLQAYKRAMRGGQVGGISAKAVKGKMGHEARMQAVRRAKQRYR